MSQNREINYNNGNSSDSWAEWRKHILLELQRLGNCYDKVSSELNDIKGSVRELKIQAGVWGLAGGLIPALVVLVYYIVEK